MSRHYRKRDWEITPKLEYRFWKKVASGDRLDCWNWKAYIHPSGYGMFAIKRKMWLVHRVAWILAYGDIPTGFCVLHKCDNRICVNHRHLFLGTYKDNAVDRDKKGRGKIPDNRGEKHGLSKLTEEQVLEIKRQCETRKLNNTQIAKAFGVNRRHIGRIASGKRWGWLDD